MRPHVTRFSLRLLLLAVTVLCCVLGYGAHWFRYGISWVHERRQFLAEQMEKRSADAMLSGHWSHVQSQNNVSKPGKGAYREQSRLLRLLGEKGYHHIAIVIPECDTVTRKLGVATYTLDTLDSHPDYRRAQRLFPEATIYPTVIKDDGAYEINVMDYRTGKVLIGIDYHGEDVCGTTQSRPTECVGTREVASEQPLTGKAAQ